MVSRPAHRRPHFLQSNNHANEAKGLIELDLTKTAIWQV
jgi:hypothetical protein